MSDEHHDFTHTSMHCVCLENEVDKLRAENAQLRAENEAYRASVIADGETMGKGVELVTKTLAENARLRAALKNVETLIPGLEHEEDFAELYAFIEAALAEQSEGDPRG